MIITILDEFIEETPKKGSTSARGSLAKYANTALWEIVDYDEKLEIREGVITRLSISSFSDVIPDEDMIITNGRSSGRCRSSFSSCTFKKGEEYEEFKTIYHHWTISTVFILRLYTEHSNE